MKKRLNLIALLSFAYIFGDLFNKGATYLLTPLYTRFLSVEEFAILAITSIIQSIGYAILSFGLIGAAFRFFFAFDTEVERKNFYGTIWIFLVFSSGLLTIILDMLGRKYFTFLFTQVPYYPYVSLAIFTIYFKSTFELIPYQVFRADEQGGLYLLYSILSVIIYTSLQLLFVVVLKQGLLGVLIGNLFAAMIMAVPYSIIIMKNINWNFSPVMLKKALSYSVPLIPHVIASWGLNFSDRFILERHVGLDQIGIYSLADLFRQGYQVLANGINGAIMPIFGRASNNPSEFHILPRLATYFTLIVASIGVIIALFTREVVRLIAPVEYHFAIRIVPWLLLGLFMQALYYLPMNAISQTVGRTKEVAFATITAGFINIGLNLLTVPKYGITAAAVNTFIGYTVLFLLVYILSRKICPIKYEILRLFKIIVSALITIIVGLIIQPDNILIGMTIKILCLFAFPLLLFISGFLTDDEKSKIKNRIYA